MWNLLQKFEKGMWNECRMNNVGSGKWNINYLELEEGCNRPTL